MAFPFVVPGPGVFVVERPRAHETIQCDCDEGDVFVISPEGVLHHNHVELCPFNARLDACAFVPKDDLP